MTARALSADPALPVALALAAALLLLLSERRRRAASASIGLALVLVPCALLLARLEWAGWAAAPLVVALVAAALARERPDPLPTGVTAPAEQWSVLQLCLSQRMVWVVALPLVLLAGVVSLGGAPFHFWVADLFQGAPAALAPLAVATLQGLGAVWLVERLEGLEVFGEGGVLAGALLRTAAAAALLAGAGTLLSQRRPERRVGTLASLQGGLALAALSITAGRGRLDPLVSVWLVPWAAHLALGLSGAALLARLTPADLAAGEPGGHLFRRHPLTAFAGLYALFSLAGVPGTPGAGLWLGVARGLAATGHSGLLIALALGWLAAFATAMRELREGFGVPTVVRPERAVPLPVRLALWLSGAGLAALGVAGTVLR